jgi:hypothetical protein
MKSKSLSDSTPAIKCHTGTAAATLIGVQSPLSPFY